MITELFLPIVGRSQTSRRLASSIPALALLVLGGCSDAPKPIVGAITVTNASGVAQPPITALKHGTQAYFLVDVTNDYEGLGADWTVTCNSSLPGVGLVDDQTCGTFAPTHTTSGPVPSYPTPNIVYIATYTAPQTAPEGGTVTITADATSLPSRTSSITLAIQ